MWHMRLARKRATHGGFVTCMETFGNGAMTGIKAIITRHAGRWKTRRVPKAVAVRSCEEAVILQASNLAVLSYGIIKSQAIKARIAVSAFVAPHCHSG